MKLLAIIAGVVIVGLALIVAPHLSPDAMAVVVGIVCGIGASIPTTIAMLLLMRPREPQAPHVTYYIEQAIITPQVESRCKSDTTKLLT